MADIIVIGGGVAGLSTGMLLANDGHRVELLERDEAPPPEDPEAAWDGWPRRGVNQFRMLHYFLPRFRSLLETELPAAAQALVDAGALRLNLIEAVPDEVSGGWRDGDERYTSLSGRRPVVEAALAGTAANTPGLEVRRGTAVAELRTGPSALDGVPHVIGVRTEDGEDLAADLVIDAGGRRSALPRWLEAIGARTPTEELEDCGFVYFGRHFRSADGSTPPIFAPLLGAYGSVSILTLPADHGTWGVGFVTSSKDAPLRGLKDVDRWSAAIKEFPLVAHWADGEPLDDGVAVMAKIEDRIRGFVVDGVPVATGVLAVGDAWACTNPSIGRGASIGLMHSVALRDLLRGGGIEQPAGLALAWDQVTAEVVEPWYRATLDFDRHRLGQVEAEIAGEPYEPGDIGWEMTSALQYGSGQDPDLLRGLMEVLSVYTPAEEVFADPAFAEKVIAVGGGWRDAPVFGPSREQLVKLVND